MIQLKNIFLLAFISGVFYSCNDNTAELKEFGVQTIAIVKNGTEKTKRNHSTYTLDIQFTTKIGTTIKTSIVVNNSEYSKVHKGAEIPIIYSSRHPLTLDLILSDASIQKHLGIKNRALNIVDLQKIVEEQEQDSVLNYLNTISYKWNKNVSEKKRLIFNNTNGDEYLTKNELGTLTYISSSYKFRIGFNKKLADLGYIKIMKDSTGLELYENKAYNLSFEKKIKNNKRVGMHTITVYNIISLRKK